MHSPPSPLLSLPSVGTHNATDVPPQPSTVLTYSCIVGNGQSYHGSLTRTNSTTQCQSWGSQQPHKHPITAAEFPHELTGAGYSCRNPGGLGERPWCYTTDKHRRWEYCDIPRCSE